MGDRHGPEASAGGGGSPGEALRDAREKYGLSIEEVASELNLSVPQVSALEENRFDDLPGKTYVQGYLKSYARLLNSDESDVLQNFNPKEEVNITGIRPVMSEGRRSDRHVKLLGLGVMLALGGLMFAWWQNREHSTFVPLEVGELEQQAIQNDGGVEEWRTPEQIAGGAGQIAQPGSTVDTHAGLAEYVPPIDVEPEAGSQSDPASPEQMVAGDAPVTVQSGAGSTGEITIDTGAGGAGANAESSDQADGGVVDQPGQTQAGATSALETADAESAQPEDDAPETAPVNNAGGGELEQTEVATTEATSTAQQPAPAAQQTSEVEEGRLVKLRFNANSWVDLRDADGRRLLYENVTGGKEISIQGNPPFSVFLGNAEGVQIDYGGKPFDFSAYTNGVYARFELGLEHVN